VSEEETIPRKLVYDMLIL